MAKKHPFGGDTVHRLAKPKLEPYRLWFEFLKLALKDPSIKVDEAFYAEWGDVANIDFNTWWKTHWRPLFAIPAPTSRLTEVAECRDALNDPDSIVLRVSLAGTLAQRVELFKKAVGDAIGDRKIRSADQPRFSLTEKRGTNLRNVRVILRLYGYSLECGGDLDAACRRYYEWATSWNTQVREKGWKREKVFMPPALSSYVQLLDELAARPKGAAKQVRGSKTTSFIGDQMYADLRAQMRRYIRQGEKIGNNVGKGEFTGTY